jgi:hypothetical protein
MDAGGNLPLDQGAKGFLVDALVLLEGGNERGAAALEIHGQTRITKT